MTLDLAGAWECRLGDDPGAPVETVVLPGSLDTNRLGTANLREGYLGGLSRQFVHTGPAWYSRTVEVPPGPFRWRLFLERCHWFSEVWLDGVRLGADDSLSAPHEFELPADLAPGQHRLEIRIDNTPRIRIGRIGHALTDWTQTNWNGIIGRIELVGRPEVAFDWVAASGSASSGSVRVSGRVLTPSPGRQAVTLRVPGACAETASDAETGRFEVELPVPNGRAWSDREPALVDIVTSVGGDTRTIRVGLRDIEARGKEVLLNGLPTFFRGTLDCCVFPKTGYPPTDVSAWRGVFEQVRAHGLNHVRFHSYCPPEAAFAAADELGVLLQVELPLWTGRWALSSDPVLLDFCRREAHRILRAYGHHPSFVLMALGNEMAFYGDEPEVDGLLNELRAAYPNRLYTFSSHGTHLSPACDFYVQADNGKPGPENRPLRGSTWFGVGSRFDREAPSTRATVNEAAAQFDRPVLAHEVAEWAVFPDVHHAGRYDGVLEARNFVAIAESMDRHGLREQAPDFVLASGKLSALLYKEEIETLLRTHGLSGYQLLGLQDFSGQGTATVGMLDAFWRPKGFVEATEFARFAGSVVPLLGFDKAVWTEGEKFVADASLFGDAEPGVGLDWTARAGTVTLAKGRLAGRQGTIAFDLPAGPCKVNIELATPDGRGVNDWNVWVYPRANPSVDLSDVLVATLYGQDVLDALAAGRRVWIRHDFRSPGNALPGRFAPAFWSPIHFKEQVGTMGTLCDPDHPAFADFPNDGHTDWQWWDVLMHSRALVLNALPRPFRPVLQVIDRYERNWKLGTVLEAKVGPGRLFISTIDFTADMDGRPASRQLLHSFEQYVVSDRFQPAQDLAAADLEALYENEP